jgi:hypothetical protein
MSDLLNSASLVLIPSGIKASKVYAQIPEDGSGDMTFSRASDATRVNSLGLVEKVRTNLITYSQDFDNASWTKQNGSTTTSNTTTAPDGTTTADTFEKAGGTGGTNYYYLVTNNTSNTTNTFSIYVKYKSGSGIVWLLGKNSGTFAYFNIQTGVALSKSSGMTTTIESVGNGWYRCSFVQDYTSASAYTIGIGVCLADGTPNYDASSASTQSVYIWGAQYEVSDFGPTAYIPTTSSAVSVGPYSNIPRLNYQNGGGGCPSLLLEAQRTNIAYPSEKFSAFAKSSDVTITDNYTTSPDGYQNADYYFCNTTTTNGYLIPNFSGTSGVQYAVSFFAKAKELSLIYIKNVNDSGGQGIFDLSNGTYTIATGIDSMSIESFGNGWYRCTTISTSSSININFVPIIKGNANQGLYIWGVQIEQGSYPSSYIPTLGTSATRVADACNKTGISSLIGQTEGTLYWELQRNNSDNDSRLQISDGGTNNWLFVSIESGLIPRVYCNVGGVNQFSVYGSTLDNGFHKLALAYKNNDFKLYVDGVASVTQTSGSVPTCSRLDVGNTAPTNDVQSPSQVKEVVLFPTRLTNSQLAELTA